MIIAANDEGCEQKIRTSADQKVTPQGNLLNPKPLDFFPRLSG